MSKDPDTEQLFADLRKTLDSQDTKVDEATLGPAVNWREAETTQMPSTESPAKQTPSEDTAGPTPLRSTTQDSAAPDSSAPERTKTMPHTTFTDTSSKPAESDTWNMDAPTPAPTPVSTSTSAPVPAPQKNGIRVGLLVWGALLVVAGIFILLTLFLPNIGGPVVMATMLIILGVFFLIGAVVSGVRKKG